MAKGAAVAKSLRAWRTERLLSTRRLAELAGSSNKTIVQLENGRQIATFATIEKLARVLEVEPREVTEFSRALDVRAGIERETFSLAEPMVHRTTHVYCVTGGAALQPLAAHLLQTGRYGVTTVVGVPVTPEQVACARPDIVVIDADAPSLLDLLPGLRHHSATKSIRIIVTGSDLHALDEHATMLTRSGTTNLTFVQREDDIRELVSALESIAVPV
jgi:transcriptional regulator with XRE-family HTH domain